MKKTARILSLLLAVLLAIAGFSTMAAADQAIIAPQDVVNYLAANGGDLPENFLTSRDLKDLGWDSSRNYVSDIAPGYSVGGDSFGNREGLLPAQKGRVWWSCDVNYVSGKRSGERLCWSNDGLYYYSPDGFKSFTQMFPDEGTGPIIEAQAIADYILDHGCLPPNFITKKEAQELGWDSSRNYVSDVAPGYSIGGDRFGNYQGLLPTKKGRQYYECDVGYVSGKRSADRIVFSNDGLVFLTVDHYNTFTQMEHSK